MRNFKRHITHAPCAVLMDQYVLKALMVNFSRMGAMIELPQALNKKKYISIMYQNEKNHLIRMLTYVVHCEKKGSIYRAGLQFVGVESERDF